MHLDLSRLFSAALALAALVASAPAHAADVNVRDAWARATLPGQKVAGVYMQLHSDTAARLVEVRSPAAATAEVHEMRHEGGVMKMRRLDVLDLPAGKTVALEPGGYHIMLLDIREPLKAGGAVKLTLIVEQGGKATQLEVTAPIRPILDDDAHNNQ